MDSDSELNTQIIDPYSQFDSVSQGQYKNYNYDKGLNLLEKITILICIVFIISSGVFGFVSQTAYNRDAQKLEDISQVLAALDQFYINSSTIPSQRAYPISVCSQKPNEVDYEYTLGEYLSGKREKFDSHIYISQDYLPNDPWGKYSQTYSQNSVSTRDCPGIFINSNQNPQDNIYADGRRSCNFNNGNTKQIILRNCYLYGSSSNGDSFELAYFSQSAGRFVIYSKYRDSLYQVSYS
jgi:hypothetical protein